MHGRHSLFSLTAPLLSAPPSPSRASPAATPPPHLPDPSRSSRSTYGFASLRPPPVSHHASHRDDPRHGARPAARRALHQHGRVVELPVGPADLGPDCAEHLPPRVRAAADADPGDGAWRRQARVRAGPAPPQQLTPASTRRRPADTGPPLTGSSAPRTSPCHPQRRPTTATQRRRARHGPGEADGPERLRQPRPAGLRRAGRRRRLRGRRLRSDGAARAQGRPAPADAQPARLGLRSGGDARAGPGHVRAVRRGARGHHEGGLLLRQHRERRGRDRGHGESAGLGAQRRVHQHQLREGSRAVRRDAAS
mmetsp:Transcript_11989/g.32404  ORF Transcript_11989/g.32404 Transcript_11989/m.32404 type:complete len:309 (-) Transcript_11989:441-1367(-)